MAAPPWAAVTVVTTVLAEVSAEALAAGTGGGRSTILRAITCQLIHHGALAFVLDYKRVSHLWARGVPGVTYCRDIAEIHQALIDLCSEGRRRIRLAEQLGEKRWKPNPSRSGRAW
jgi:hypothetical protein